MNTTQSTARQPLLDKEWIIVINEEIAARPETLGDVVEPELLGRFCCEMGEVCNPTKYYVRSGDIDSFVAGYKDTEAILHAQLESTQDYEDWQDDVEWMRRGC